MHVLQDGLLT